MSRFKEEKKDANSWIRWGLLWLILLAVIAFGLNSMGYLGSTIIKREVMVNSHQYHESKKAEVALYEAALDEIQIKLNDSSLSETVRANYEAEAAGIRRQLRAARAK
jgi:hypothetical protein